MPYPIQRTEFLLDEVTRSAHVDAGTAIHLRVLAFQAGNLDDARTAAAHVLQAVPSLIVLAGHRNGFEAVAYVPAVEDPAALRAQVEHAGRRWDLRVLQAAPLPFADFHLQLTTLCGVELDPAPALAGIFLSTQGLDPARLRLYAAAQICAWPDVPDHNCRADFWHDLTAAWESGHLDRALPAASLENPSSARGR